MRLKFRGYKEGVMQDKPKPAGHWERMIAEGLRGMLESLHEGDSLAPEDYEEHTEDTPNRVVKAYREFFVGCKIDPRKILERSFTSGSYDQMVTVMDLDVTSFCSHHLLPFVGKAHFAYVPNGKIVGLSKVPRFIDVLAARPQVQERLSQQIVDIFQDTVGPLGCGVVLDCLHTCMSVRGVKKTGITRTTALRGVFTQDTVRNEFLTAIGRAK